MVTGGGDVLHQWGVTCSVIVLLGTCLAPVGVTAIAYSSVSSEPGLQCYQFTWVKNQNLTECDDLEDDTLPCKTPFIYTDPPDLPPNITDLNAVCQKMSCASYICSAGDEQCLRWVKYDLQNDPMFMTLYCGSMFDITKIETSPKEPPEVNNECFLNRNGTTRTEACTCGSKDLCNPAGRMTPCYGLLLMAAAVYVLTVNIIY